MIRTYPTESGGYVMSEGGTWVPGVFDSPEAAKLAAETLTDAQIVEKLGPIYEFDKLNRPATIDDVKAASQ